MHFRTGLCKAGVLLGAALSGLLLHAAPSNAETLREALAATYVNSPELEAARARLRAVDEGVPQARAGYLPQLTFDAGIGPRRTRSDMGSTGGGILRTNTGPRYVEIKLVQPIFDGMKAYNGVNRAEALQRAEREALRNAEQTAMYATVEAFMRVIASNQIMEIRQNELAFLGKEARSSRDRSRSGQASQADYAQARARTAAAETGLNAAGAQLNAWTARYIQNVGHEPKNLKLEKKTVDRVPKSYELAVNEALQGHPAILAAQFNAEAARAAVEIARGDFMPTVSVEGSVGRSWDTGGADQVDDAWLGLRVSVPLYRGGATSSKVREASERLGEAEMQLAAVQNQILSNMQIVWGDYLAAQASISSAQAQVEAQTQALSGIQAEERVGARSPLDVLNAQSELVSARISLVEARTQSAIATYGILAAMGKLDSLSLGLSVDPIEGVKAASGRK